MSSTSILPQGAPPTSMLACININPPLITVKQPVAVLNTCIARNFCMVENFTLFFSHEVYPKNKNYEKFAWVENDAILVECIFGDVANASTCKNKNVKYS